MGFDVGRVLDRAWDYFKKGALWYALILIISGTVTGFLVLLGLVGVLVAVFGGLIGAGSQLTSETFVSGLLGSLPGLAIFLLVIFLAVAIGALQVGTMVEVTSQISQGYRVDLGVAFRWVLHRFWSYLGVGFLVGLATVFGMILLIIPGLLVLAYWALAQYLVGREGRGAIDALGRSARLVGPAVGWVLLILALFVGLQLAIPVGTAVLDYLGTDVAQTTSFILTLVSMPLSFLLTLLYYPLLAALYDELKGLEKIVT